MFIDAFSGPGSMSGTSEIIINMIVIILVFMECIGQRTWKKYTENIQ